MFSSLFCKSSHVLAIFFEEIIEMLIIISLLHPFPLALSLTHIPLAVRDLAVEMYIVYRPWHKGLIASFLQ